MTMVDIHETPPKKVLRYRAISRTFIILICIALVILQVLLLLSIQSYGRANHSLGESNQALVIDVQELLEQIKDINITTKATLDTVNKSLSAAGPAQEKFITDLISQMNISLKQQLSTIRFSIQRLSTGRLVVRVVPACSRACKRQN